MRAKIYLIILILVVLAGIGFFINIRYPLLPGLITGKTRMLKPVEDVQILVNNKPQLKALLFRGEQDFQGKAYDRYYLMIPQKKEAFNYTLIIDLEAQRIGYPHEAGKEGAALWAGKYLLQNRDGDSFFAYYNTVDEEVSFNFRISPKEISFKVPYGNIFSYEGKEIRILF